MIRAVELCDRAEDGKVCGGLGDGGGDQEGGLRRMRGADLCRWLSANYSHDHRFPFVSFHFLISFRMAVRMIGSGGSLKAPALSLPVRSAAVMWRPLLLRGCGWKTKWRRRFNERQTVISR